MERYQPHKNHIQSLQRPAELPWQSHYYFKHLPKVLLVEDNDAARHYQSLVLEALGCEVISVACGYDAIVKLHQHFDAVMLDIDLPDISGYQLASIIKRKQPLLPMIACSGFGEDVKKTCLASGISYVLHKPLGITDTFFALEQCFERSVH